MSALTSIWGFICLKIVSPFRWSWLIALLNNGKYWELNSSDWAILQKYLTDENLIILTRRKTHLSTYLIAIGGLLKTGKFGYWSHALMNLEDLVMGIRDFRLVEAIGTGTTWSTFAEVFDCDSVCLLRPRGLVQDDWEAMLAQAKGDIGKPYDTLFDYQQDQKLSCVELVRDCLEKTPFYDTRFINFENMVQKYQAITPDMFYGCSDFEVVLEIRR